MCHDRFMDTEIVKLRYNIQWLNSGGSEWSAGTWSTQVGVHIQRGDMRAV